MSYQQHRSADAFQTRPVEMATFDFIEAINAMDRPGDIIAALQMRVVGFGYGSFVVTGLPKLMEELAPPIVMDAWPTGWGERYHERGYLSVDPIARWATRATSSFRWRDAPPELSASKAARDFMGEAADVALRDGFCVPIPQFGHGRGTVSFVASALVDASPREMTSLEMMGIYAANAVRSLVAPPTLLPTPLLAPRERECLSWVAAGKSAWDISVILGLSESTVHGYLKDVRRKLRVNTMAHAVAEAVRLRELSL